MILTYIITKEEYNNLTENNILPFIKEEGTIKAFTLSQISNELYVNHKGALDLYLLFIDASNFKNDVIIYNEHALVKNKISMDDIFNIGKLPEILDKHIELDQNGEENLKSRKKLFGLIDLGIR